FTRFFRAKTAEAESQQAQVAKAAAAAAPRDKEADPTEDLIARTLRDSQSLIDNRSIANAAAALPAPNVTEAPSTSGSGAPEFPAGSGAAAGRRSAPENLHPSLLAGGGGSGSSQTPAASPANAQRGWESENWSLLDNLPSTSADAAPRTGGASGAPEFP